MECLRDYIGIYGCSSTTPLSNKYINQLPGISLESIETLADDEQRNYLGVWNDVQTRALAKFGIDVNEKFAKHYRLKQIRNSVDLLRTIDTNTVHAAAATNRGFSIEMSTQNSVFTASNLQSVFVQTLSFYIIDKTVIGATFVITAVDLDRNSIVDTFTINIADISNGWNTVVVNRLYDVDRLAFTYDATLVQSYRQQLQQYAYYNYSYAVSAVYGGFANPYLRGIEYTVINAPVFGSDQFGLTCVFSVVCKFDKLVCNNKESFTYPLWYLLGAELMIERMNSDRMSYFNTIGRDKASDLYKDFMVEYDRSLSQITDSTKLNAADACLECNEQIRLVETRM